MQSDKVYPIAETFTSIQGEGVYTGTMMHFIRLAGCNVGKYATEDAYGGLKTTDVPLGRVPPNDFPLVQTQAHSICESVLGQKFVCDTNYHMKHRWSAMELRNQPEHPVEHYCITGGEPFLHELRPLIETLQPAEVHIETSGTLPIDGWIATNAWVTCSPKVGFLPDNIAAVSEWKFIIADNIDITRLYNFVKTYELETYSGAPIYLQPINYVSEVDRVALDMVLACIERNPQYRLSVQMHKFLNVR